MTQIKPTVWNEYVFDSIQLDKDTMKYIQEEFDAH